MHRLEGKDGLARDIAKLKICYSNWKHSQAIKQARKRIKLNKDITHDITNLLVESCRDTNYVGASYFMGHIMMVGMVLSIVTIGTLIWVS